MQTSPEGDQSQHLFGVGPGGLTSVKYIHPCAKNPEVAAPPSLCDFHPPHTARCASEGEEERGGTLIESCAYLNVK